ncbi:hypothetical protein KC327_g76 [Hortaea werneckii]|nr:hypothetical protein KC327_g76 [Hortaea werneckii]
MTTRILNDSMPNKLAIHFDTTLFLRKPVAILPHSACKLRRTHFNFVQSYAILRRNVLDHHMNPGVQTEHECSTRLPHLEPLEPDGKAMNATVVLPGRFDRRLRCSLPPAPGKRKSRWQKDLEDGPNRVSASKGRWASRDARKPGTVRSTCGKRDGIALDRAELAWLGAGKMSPAPVACAFARRKSIKQPPRLTDSNRAFVWRRATPLSLLPTATLNPSLPHHNPPTPRKTLSPVRSQTHYSASSERTSRVAYIMYFRTQMVLGRLAQTPTMCQLHSLATSRRPCSRGTVA